MLSGLCSCPLSLLGFILRYAIHGARILVDEESGSVSILYRTSQPLEAWSFSPDSVSVRRGAKQMLFRLSRHCARPGVKSHVYVNLVGDTPPFEMSGACVKELVYYELKRTSATGVGVPQGWVVSPLLCNLYFGKRDIKFSSLKHPVFLARWMDDLLAVFSQPESSVQDLLSCATLSYDNLLSTEKTSFGSALYDIDLGVVNKVQTGIFKFAGVRFSPSVNNYGKFYLNPSPAQIRASDVKIRWRMDRLLSAV
eukprot:Blabericola_migrator_1__1172@NODE_12_length_24658_cov_176_683258_g9_i0_p12_GENE_NODE_12_length_24658_cov_176_683258_g9_i0NODE_12_length_24658_cov_176_683258_g9_i0_p12_ORF_typecomplete_len253_score27_03RVT_1/PF00078_27/1_1e03RVT_1/PF00078_27/5_3e09_NODE_12_length_24658_cov_176_683258_g9_i07471505